MGEPVADLEIILTGNTGEYVTSMERAATSGTAAATAPERAEKASASVRPPRPPGRVCSASLSSN